MSFIHLTLWAVVVCVLKIQVNDLHSELAHRKQLHRELKQKKLFISEYGQFLSQNDFETVSKRIESLQQYLNWR